MSWGDPPASSPEVRARMQRVRVKDTKPELELRAELRALGVRGYRVDAPLPLDGVRRRSDLTFGPARVVVFVDGCYWHGCPSHFRPSGRNEAWWREKIERTRARDLDTDLRLIEEGWVVVRVWEHERPSEAALRVKETVELCRRACAGSAATCGSGGTPGTGGAPASSAQRSGARPTAGV